MSGPAGASMELTLPALPYEIRGGGPHCSPGALATRVKHQRGQERGLPCLPQPPRLSPVPASAQSLLPPELFGWRCRWKCPTITSPAGPPS